MARIEALWIYSVVKRYRPPEKCYCCWTDLLPLLLSYRSIKPHTFLLLSTKYCIVVQSRSSRRCLATMYNGIGLRTVRGSATSGYVNANKAYVRPSQVRKVTAMNTGTLNVRFLSSVVMDLKPHRAYCLLVFQLESALGPAQVKANEEIMAHKQKRVVILSLKFAPVCMLPSSFSSPSADVSVCQVEAKLYALEEIMTEQGYSAAEIEKRLAAERRKLENKPTGRADGGGAADSHSVAVRKEAQMKTLASAFGLATDFREGEVGRPDNCLISFN